VIFSAIRFEMIAMDAIEITASQLIKSWEGKNTIL
jgi:hypothetical protein